MNEMTVDKAVAVYRDTPNTFGHQELHAQKMLLKEILGLVASQRHLQDSIEVSKIPEASDSPETSYGGYCDESVGIRFMWERLKKIEDRLRELEKVYGTFVTTPYKTLPGNVNAVPSLVLKSQMEE
ncbi:hypothetical protein [Pseudomonas phage vB_Pae_WS1160]